MVKEDAKAQALSAATSEFEKLFKKQDFGRMKVVACLSACYQLKRNVLCVFIPS